MQQTVVETYLSREPRANSAFISLVSIGVVFLFSIVYWGNSFGLADFLAAKGRQVFVEHQYWRLFTGILVHADLMHFLSNAMGLFLFGYLLYGYFGVRVYPVAALLSGAVVNAVSLATYSDEITLVGASGVVYLAAAFWLTLFVLIERRFSVANRLLRSVGFSLVMLLSSTFDPGVSYRTHAIGLIVGIVFGLSYFLMEKNKFRSAERTADDDEQTG